MTAAPQGRSSTTSKDQRGVACSTTTSMSARCRLVKTESVQTSTAEHGNKTGVPDTARHAEPFDPSSFQATADEPCWGTLVAKRSSPVEIDQHRKMCCP